jgi:hypothetical protein
MFAKDFLLGNDGDLILNEGMDAIPTDSLCQRINIALRWFFGEWKFDYTRGTDWLGIVFVKNPDEQEIESMITNVLMSFTEIVNVSAVTINVDNQKRTAVITWKAQTSQEVIESEVNLWNTE